MLPHSDACERNKGPILTILRDALQNTAQVLEIGSGTGQHAVYFAQHLSHLIWQPSDCSVYIEDIKQRVLLEGNENCKPPLTLDVSEQPWPITQVDAVFSANTLHIMSLECVMDFFHGIGRIIKPNGLLCIYGPFKYRGNFTSQSNEHFDHRLKQYDVLSGIRDFEAINIFAEEEGFTLLQDHVLPANNQLLIWQKNNLRN